MQNEKRATFLSRITMIYRIDFDKDVLKTLKKYKKSNPNRFKKLSKLLDDIAEHPRTGIGHPEPLVGGSNITYSRHIAGRDRIIYDIYDETINVYVLEIEGHYDDK